MRDRFKAIFDKTRVDTRGELVAGLFSTHVLPLMHGATDHIEDPATTS